jgi:murein L,D-transpeptidase YcbB/YkuD
VNGTPRRAGRLGGVGLLLALTLLSGCRVDRVELRPEPATQPVTVAPVAVEPAWSPEQLGAALAASEPIVVAGVTLTEVAALRSFYAARRYQSAFTGADCARRMPELVEALKLAEAHGLDPTEYAVEMLAGAEACQPAHELVASDAWLRLARHLHAGRVDPRQVEPDWTASRPSLDAAGLLARALAADQLVDSLAAVAPQDAYYRALQQALVRWRERAANPDPAPSLEDGSTLREGDAGPRVRQLRDRLAAEGDPVEADPPEVYDAALAEQVRRLQAAVHLEADGAAGKETLAELRRTPAERVAQLRVNLERWRWLPDDLGERQIRVNIADFQLEARAGGQIERVHRIIVGRQLRRTPSFSAAMRYVVVNPSWGVPRRLAVEDKLPLFRKDPAAVQRMGFQVLDASGATVDPAGIDWAALSKQNFPYRLRQAPGPQNALGRVKLMFPNRHDVYLHDTPTRGLFERSRRNFSSGCIRVEAPLELAAWALAGTPDASLERLEELSDRGGETVIRLAEPLTVHILYLTAVVDDGEVRFVYDLYGRDAPLLALLDR